MTTWTKQPPSEVPGFYWVRWLDGPPVVSHVRPRYEDEPDCELWIAYHEEPVSRSGEDGWQFWPERVEPPGEGFSGEITASYIEAGTVDLTDPGQRRALIERAEQAQDDPDVSELGATLKDAIESYAPWPDDVKARVIASIDEMCRLAATIEPKEG